LLGKNPGKLRCLICLSKKGDHFGNPETPNHPCISYLNEFFEFEQNVDMMDFDHSRRWVNYK